MSIQLSTRVMHVKDQTTGSYDSVDILKSGGVDDVQVNGTSVVTDGVANVPIASSSAPGVVTINTTRGLRMIDNDIATSGAGPSGVKAGSNAYNPITPEIQHASAFYGLAKASGDTTQSASTNPVGTYTDAAKIAIQKMLGLSQQGELIADVTATEDLTEFNILTDINGQQFRLTKMIVLFSAGPPTTGTRDSFYTMVHFHTPNDDSINYSLSAPSFQYPIATSNMLARMEVDAYEGMPVIPTAVVATGQGNTQNMQSMVRTEIAKELTGFRIYQSGTEKSLIPSGSNIKIYGIRA